jgi:hypothetical protein
MDIGRGHISILLTDQDDCTWDLMKKCISILNSSHPSRPCFNTDNTLNGNGWFRLFALGNPSTSYCGY